MSNKHPTVSPPTTQTHHQEMNRVIAFAAAILNTNEAATYLNVKPTTLEQWRWNGRGPLYVKIGRSVKYRLADLDTFVTERVFTSTTEEQASKREVDNAN